MKLYVVNGYWRFTTASTANAARITIAAQTAVHSRSAFISLAVNRKLVVYAKFALGHPAQLTFHYYFAGYMSAQHLTLRWHKQIDVFEYVEKQFVASIFDALSAPSYLTRYLIGYLSGLFFGLRLDSLLSYVGLQDAYVGVLWVAEVEYFF